MPSIDDLNELLGCLTQGVDTNAPPVGEVVARARQRRSRRRMVGASLSLVLIGAISAVFVAVARPGRTEVRTDYAAGTNITGRPLVPAHATYSRLLPDGYELSVDMDNPMPYGPFKLSPDRQVPDGCSTKLVVGVHKDVSQVPSGTMGGSMVDFVDVGGGREILSSVAFPAMLGLPPESNTKAFRLVATVVDAKRGATYRLLRDDEIVDQVVADGPLLGLSATTNAMSGVDGDSGGDISTLTKHYSVVRLSSSGNAVELDLPAVATAKKVTSETGCDPAVDDSIWHDGTAPEDRADSESRIRNLIAAEPGSREVIGGLPVGFPKRLNETSNAADVRDVHWVSSTEAWVEYTTTSTSDPTPSIPNSHSNWVEVRLDGGVWKLTPAGACALVSALHATSCVG